MSDPDDIIEEDAYEDIELRPQFTLVVFDEPEQSVDITVSLPQNPDDRPANMALLYGMALLSLDADGSVQQRMLDLIKNNPDENLTQKAACESIRLLLMETPHDSLI